MYAVLRIAVRCMKNFSSQNFRQMEIEFYFSESSVEGRELVFRINSSFNTFTAIVDLSLRQPTLPLSIRINTGSLYRNVSLLNYKRDKDNVS